MLCECFGKLEENAFVKGLRAFIRSIWFIVLIAFLMVCANLFSWELPVFYLYLAFGFVIVMFDDDLKGIIPIACCAYMTISYENNPALNSLVTETPSAFYNTVFKIQLIFLLVSASILILARLITLLIDGEKKKLPRLTFGFLALGVALILGGVFSKYYTLRTAIFGFVVLASLCVLYFLFYYGVKWKKMEKDYFAYLFMIIGLFLIFELLGIYVKSGAFKEITNREILQTGWGMYNNVGCVFTMCLPAPLYLSIKKKHGWLYMLATFALAVGLIFTQSRGSILFGAFIFLAGLIIVLVKCEKKRRLPLLIVVGAALLVSIVVAIILRNQIRELFESMLRYGFFEDNGRYEVYRDGLAQFKEEPFFGIGFYECKAFRWGSLSENAFLPPRYHNTLLQMLTSCGIFGLICYLFHRFQTVWLLFRRPTLEKTFIALAISGLLLTSLIECHFFSFGPGLLYAVLLVCAEGTDLKKL